MVNILEYLVIVGKIVMYISSVTAETFPRQSQLRICGGINPILKYWKWLGSNIIWIVLAV